MEESGLSISNLRVIAFINFLKHADEGHHYLDVGVVADWVSGVPEVREPDKRVDWQWYDPAHLPAPLWDQIPLYFESFKTGTMYQGTIR